MWHYSPELLFVASIHLKSHCNWQEHKINICHSCWRQQQIVCQKKGVVNPSYRTHLAVIQFIIPIRLIRGDSHDIA